MGTRSCLDALRSQRRLRVESFCDLSVEERSVLFNLCRETIEHNWNHFYNGGFEAVLWQELKDMLNELEFDSR
jgi:hypothetical protein